MIDTCYVKLIQVGTANRVIWGDISVRAGVEYRAGLVYIDTYRTGDIVLDQDERSDSGMVAARWNGDLHDFSMRAWAEDGDLAAMVLVTPNGHARGWLNLRHVHPPQRAWVWMRLRNTAARRGSDVLLAEDLMAMPSPGGDQQAQEA